MFKWLTRNTEPASKETEPPIGFVQRLKMGLGKTRHQLGDGLTSLILGKKKIDAELYQAIERQLLAADVGIKTTTSIIEELTQRMTRHQLADSDALYPALQEILLNIVQPVAMPLLLEPTQKPFVILMIGVNGSGKTTTIGKLAKQLQLAGKRVMLAAGDTFRAAAIEQLKAWGERNQIPVIAQHTGADSASVIYDAFAAAKARQMDVLIADTAGRLHTQHHLMAELEKIKRVLGKLDPEAPHELMLVLDAGIGQNALAQAHEFLKAVGVTGITMTKLDGTAKGGILFAIAKECQLPIRFIGIGEHIDDLQPFDAHEFIAALFSNRGLSEELTT